MDSAAVLSLADEAAAYDGADPLDEATRLTLRNRPERAAGRLEEDGFALVIGEELSLVVRPEARGAGLGRRLLESTLAEHPGTLLAWSHGDHPAARSLAATHSFVAARELWVMRRPDEPLPALDVPDGVEIRGYRPDDESELLRVNAAAFAAHPEQGSLDAAGLAERMAEPWFDPEGLLVADTGTGLAGFHWTKRHSATLGEVYVVGIDPAAQGRGLGRTLTLAGLHHLARSGISEVLLYVESDNTAAVRTYLGLGFGHDPADTHVQYRRT